MKNEFVHSSQCTRKSMKSDARGKEFASTRWILTQRRCQVIGHSSTICWSRVGVEVTRDGKHIRRHAPVEIPEVNFDAVPHAHEGSITVGTGGSGNSRVGRIACIFPSQESTGAAHTATSRRRQAGTRWKAVTNTLRNPESQPTLGTSSSTLLQLIQGTTLHGHHHACTTNVSKTATR